jgi:hypothetical protein
MSDLYLDLKKEFVQLITCEKIWDNVSSVKLNQIKTKQKASTGVQIEEVEFSLKNIHIIESEHQAFYLQNFNGDNIYIYPSFCLMLSNDLKFIVIDIRELEFKIEEQKMMYIEEPPSDAEIIEETYIKVNKDGTPDKRFIDNRIVPILKFGRIIIQSKSGLNEVFSFSNFEKANSFCMSINQYLDKLNKIKQNDH